MQVPGTVVLASTLQFALAATFVVVPIVAYIHGAAAQRAAEADVVRQGYPAEILARHRVKFEERAVDALFPFGIAASLAVLAALNLAGSAAGQVLTWIFQALLLVAGTVITSGQVFTVRSVESALRKSRDPDVRGVDVRSFVAAGAAAFPRWLRPLILVRFALITVGSVLVIVLLALPPSNAYLR